MPAPKRRHSRSRSRKRRTFYKAKVPAFARCPNCGQPHLPHRVCPHCGYYRGQSVIFVKEST